MKTTDSLIRTLYGCDAAAAEALNVGRTAVCNWHAAGCFPAYLLPKLLVRAAEKKVRLSIKDIPLSNPRGVAA